MCLVPRKLWWVRLIARNERVGEKQHSPQSYLLEVLVVFNCCPLRTSMVKRCRIQSFPFVLYDLSFLLYIFYLYWVIFFPFALCNFHLYYIIFICIILPLNHILKMFTLMYMLQRISLVLTMVRLSSHKLYIYIYIMIKIHMEDKLYKYKL